MSSCNLCNRQAERRWRLSNTADRSNHPPLYCSRSLVDAGWLTPSDKRRYGAYVSVWAARSLPALLGASIPAVYGLSRLAFRSPLVSQLAAAMMAVSPGIFLAQEARHYTLAFWVIASLSCLVIAAPFTSTFYLCG